MAANWLNELGHTQWNNFCQALKKNGDIKKVMIIIFYLKDKKKPLKKHSMLISSIKKTPFIN